MPRGLGNVMPAAELPPKFYRSLVMQYRATQGSQLQIDVAEGSVSRICEALSYTSEQSGRNIISCQFKPARVPYHAVNEEVADFLWESCWKVLPTKDRLQRWGLVNNASCPNCDNSLESNDHVLHQCVVARTFWSLISRRYSFRAPNRARTNIEHLVVALALFVIWKFRCRAVAQGRRIRPMHPRLHLLNRLIMQNLQTSLFTIGETEFLRHWGDRFIKVRNGRVVPLTLSQT